MNAPISIGQELSYVSLDSISVCKAIVKSIGPRGVDLDVYSPGCSNPVSLSGIPYHDGPARHCQPGHCFSPTKGEPA